MPKKVDISKLMKRLIIVGLLAIIGMLIVGNKFVQRYGYSGLGEFAINYWDNKQLADEADPVLLEIEMSDNDYKFIEEKRQEALERGIQINIGDNYVNCDITSGGETIPAEIRLKGHMTDHLEGEKWSFRVKSDKEILGMYRFSLQHPGTRNYAYEWVYHQLLKQEGIIYLNYDFVHLKLRGKDLGIYALEEHFGQHVLEHNDRPNGAILRWNPNLYWEWRIDELDGLYLDEQYSAYTSSFAEPYDKSNVRKDSLLVETYMKGATLLEEFRRGERNTSEVFDVVLMAKFHAIIDLVGGYHSLDWSDVKFFYNSETGLIEPVGYESFSVRISERIAGQRIPLEYDQVGTNYHDRLFADPIFFAEYVKQLERICDEQFFNEFISSIKTDLNKELAIIATEWPERRFSYDPYFENIDLIKHNLELPKPFHAFMDERTDSTLILSVAPVSDYPIEIFEIEINGKQTIPISNYILPTKARDTYAHYFRLEIHGIETKARNMVLKARIPGGSTVFEIEVAEYPPFEPMKINTGVELRDLSEHPQVKYNEREEAYFFDDMKVDIEDDYEASECSLRIMPGQEITFKGGSITLNKAVVDAQGQCEVPIIILSEKEQSFLVLNASDASFSNVDFIGKGSGIKSNYSSLRFDECAMVDFEDEFVVSNQSEVVISNSHIGSVELFGVLFSSELLVKNVKAINGGTFVKSEASNIKIIESNFEKFIQVFHLSSISTLRMWRSELDDNEKIAQLVSSSEFYTYGGDLGKANVGFKVQKEDEFGANSYVNMYRTESSKIATLKNYF